MGELTNWDVFFASLSPPTCEVYNKLAHIGFLMVLAHVALDARDPNEVQKATADAGLRIAELRLAYDDQFLLSVLDELEKASNDASGR